MGLDDVDAKREYTFCLHHHSRDVRWKRPIPPTGSLLATDQGIYLRSNRIVALDTATGKERWSCAAAGCGPLNLIDDLVHFSDAGTYARLVALHQQSGKAAWEITGLRSCDALTKIENTGYIKTQDGILHAIDLRGRRRS